MHSYLYTELRALSGWPLKQVCGLSDLDSKPTTVESKILLLIANHFAFRGVYVRICNAKDCKTARWAI